MRRRVACSSGTALTVKRATIGGWTGFTSITARLTVRMPVFRSMSIRRRNSVSSPHRRPEPILGLRQAAVRCRGGQQSAVATHLLWGDDSVLLDRTVGVFTPRHGCRPRSRSLSAVVKIADRMIFRCRI